MQSQELVRRKKEEREGKSNMRQDSGELEVNLVNLSQMEQMET